MPELSTLISADNEFKLSGKRLARRALGVQRGTPNICSQEEDDCVPIFDVATQRVSRKFHNGSYRLHMRRELPVGLCSAGCEEGMTHNGVCDEACKTPLCHYDWGGNRCASACNT